VTTETEPQPFAYLSAPNAPLYGRVLSVFARARDRFTVHLRPEDVHGDLRRDEAEDSGTVTVEAVPLEAVSAALEKLVDWGNLRADADTGRVTTVEDFNPPPALPTGRTGVPAREVWTRPGSGRALWPSRHWPSRSANTGEPISRAGPGG
jgi:hypothetical protein